MPDSISPLELRLDRMGDIAAVRTIAFSIWFCACLLASLNNAIAQPQPPCPDGALAGALCLVRQAMPVAATPSIPSRACKNPDALGTSRVMAVGTSGGGAVGRKSYPQTLPLADGEVVLTFDDGPWPGTTQAVLDALADECVKATFFLVGQRVREQPDLARAILAEGHTIGHHSMTHPNLSRLKAGKAEEDILRGMAAVDDALGPGHSAPFFRFPGFADTSGLLDWLAARDVATFGADLWASDWNPMTPNAQLRLVLSRLAQTKRGIVLFHDTHTQTAAMIPDFLRALKSRGYRVVHLVPGPGPIATAP